MVYSKETILSDGHWTFELYKQRITTKQYRELLLNNDDKIIFRGNLTQLIGKYMGAGVYEIYKEPGK